MNHAYACERRGDELSLGRDLLPAVGKEAASFYVIPVLAPPMDHDTMRRTLRMDSETARRWLDASRAAACSATDHPVPATMASPVHYLGCGALRVRLQEEKVFAPDGGFLLVPNIVKDVWRFRSAVTAISADGWCATAEARATIRAGVRVLALCLARASIPDDLVHATAAWVDAEAAGPGCCWTLAKQEQGWSPAGTPGSVLVERVLDQHDAARSTWAVPRPWTAPWSARADPLPARAWKEDNPLLLSVLLFPTLCVVLRPCARGGCRLTGVTCVLEPIDEGETAEAKTNDNALAGMLGGRPVCYFHGDVVHGVPETDAGMAAASASGMRRAGHYELPTADDGERRRVVIVAGFWE